MPGTASTGVPVEGETLDQDIIAATSSSEPKEEQLLQAMSDNYQKLHALYRAQKDKLDSRAELLK